MTLKPTHYDTLGITPGAPQEIIDAVYRAWMKAMRAHPDLGGDEEQAKAINAAYEILSNEKKRALYDAELARDERQMERGARRAKRVVVKATIAFASGNSGMWEEAQVCDASALGLRVQCTRLLQPSEHLTISFPARRDRAIEATVRWVKGMHDREPLKCEAGIEFFHPIPEILWCLKKARV